MPLKNKFLGSVSLIFVGAISVTAITTMAIAGQSVEEGDIDDVTIIAERMAPSKGDKTLNVRVFEAEDLATGVGMSLDHVLDDDPAFSLFRRTTSTLTHPSTRGVSLRGFGTNGAGRALVTVDGVPMNDPFGGWVDWPGILGNWADARLYKGAGFPRWGSGALTGSIELTSRRIEEDGADIDVFVGSHDTKGYRIKAQKEASRGGFYLNGLQMMSDGPYALAEGDRGSIDRPLYHEVVSIDTGGQLQLSDDTRMMAKVKFYDDKRGNGLLLANDRTEGFDASLHVIGQVSARYLTWQVNGYYQHRRFENVFASVLSRFEPRDDAQEVLDQYRVPGRALGINGFLRFDFNALSEIELGGDVKSLKGETNEAFRNLGDGYTRRRTAGGQQLLAGAYGRWSHTPLDSLTLDASVRLDAWQVSNGMRQEFDLFDNSLIRDDVIANKSGVTPAFRLGFAYDMSDYLTLKASGYRGFRLPTINEYYRPYRVGNDITEANPNLKPETLTGVEASLSGDVGETVSWSLGTFYQRLSNGVGNVTLLTGGGVHPEFGFVPTDGVLRQRTNIDGSRAFGFEGMLDVRFNDYLAFNSAYQYMDSKVLTFDQMPGLEGNRLPQSPKHRGMVGVTLMWPNRFEWATNVHMESARYEDDLMQRSLDGATWMDTRMDARIREHVGVYLWIENLTKENIIARVDGNGLAFIARPRQIRLGLKVDF